MHLFLYKVYQKENEEVELPQSIVKTLGEYSYSILEIIGVLIILLVAVYALIHAIRQLLHRTNGTAIFYEARHRLIRGILLGLDFLVAADLIRTVAIEISYRSIGVLAIIVVIRILLSFSLEVEMTGYWPWQKNQKQD